MIVTFALLLVTSVLALIGRWATGVTVPGWLTVLDVALAVLAAACLVVAVLLHRRVRRVR